MYMLVSKFRFLRVLDTIEPIYSLLTARYHELFDAACSQAFEVTGSEKRVNLQKVSKQSFQKDK